MRDVDSPPEGAGFELSVECQAASNPAILPCRPLYLGTKPGTIRPSLERGREMARPASNLHLQPKNGGWRARVLVPVELQAKLGKKLFHTPVWRVSQSEPAVLAYPEVRKFEALIERAKSGGSYCETVEAESEGPLTHLAFPSVRGFVTADT